MYEIEIMSFIPYSLIFDHWEMFSFDFRAEEICQIENTKMNTSLQSLYLRDGREKLLS